MASPRLQDSGWLLTLLQAIAPRQRSLCCTPHHTQLPGDNPLPTWKPGFFQPPGLCGFPTGAWMPTGLWAPAGAMLTIKLLPTSSNLAVAQIKLGIQVSQQRPSRTLAHLCAAGSSAATPAGSCAGAEPAGCSPLCRLEFTLATCECAATISVAHLRARA